MKRLLAVALGILTAIGGFVDIGDLVTNALVGARFGLSLGWVVVVGVARHLRVRRDVADASPPSAAARRSTWSGSGSGPRVGLAQPARRRWPSPC